MKRLLPIVMGFALLLLSSTEGWSADFKTGAIAYKNGDYASALREWEPLAEQGNTSGQFNLGFMYQYGKGITKNGEKAVRWYRLAAEQGNADAKVHLGLMYRSGKGVVQDFIRSHMWRIAASQGDHDARERRNNIAKKMTHFQRETSQYLAHKCVRKKYKGC